MPLLRIRLTRKNSSRKRRREQRGIYLLEVLVALTIGGIIAFALLQTLASSMNTMGTSQNEAYANEIIDELLEHTRAYGYKRLVNFPGDHVLMLNKLTQGTTGPDVDKRPVLLDLIGKQWKPKTQTDLLNGTVTYSVAPGTLTESLLITISVAWSDSYTQQSVRTVTRSINIFNTN